MFIRAGISYVGTLIKRHYEPQNSSNPNMCIFCGILFQYKQTRVVTLWGCILIITSAINCKLIRSETTLQRTP